MDLPMVFGTAVALAMDAFVVSMGACLSLGKPNTGQVFRLAFHFGLFQGLMPIVGWLSGVTVADAIHDVDHWIAFALLAIIGVRMIKEGLGPTEFRTDCPDPTRGLTLIVLATATSIDALAVGLSLALVGVSIWLPAAVIAIVAAAFTLVGLRIGGACGSRFGNRTAVLGGVILLAIGSRILLEHITSG